MRASQPPPAIPRRDPRRPFIELYVAPVTVPTIGRSLLGDAGYERLRKR